MSWDDDKSTAADPDNPSADEQLTATEWDNHVTDQKGRVPFGPVADRPAAGDASNGDVWFVTDLASDAGVFTKLVSGSWEIMGFGSSASPVPAIVTDDLDIGTADFASTGDFLAVGPSATADEESRVSTTSTSFVGAGSGVVLQWDEWLPTDAQGAVYAGVDIGNTAGDWRVQNIDDSETIATISDVNSRTTTGPTNYTPSTTASPIRIRGEIRTNDGGTASNEGFPVISFGVQL